MSTGPIVSRRIASAIASLCGAVALIGAPAPAASATGCPNEAIREAQTSEALPLGSTVFPGCMALEMLSPPKKFGQEANEVNAFSADGTRALFRSKAALADTEGLQTFLGDAYLATRSSAGWATAPTSPPKEAEILAGGGTFGGPFAFSEDLARWVLFGATQAQQYPAEAQFFSDGLADPFAPLSPLLVPINDSGTTIQTEISNLAPSGASADLSAVVFPTVFESAYFPEDPTDVGPLDTSYLAYRDEAGEAALALLARDRDGVLHGGRCGADLGGGGGNLSQGAISPEGSRIYLSTRPAQPWDEEEAKGPVCDSSNPLRIMVREETPSGPVISELLPADPAVGDDLYQGASLDGSKVFLASPRKLAASDLDTSAEACGSNLGASKGCDLYLYDKGLPEGERLIQVSAGENVSGKHTAGKEANVLASTIAISPDGSHVYFAAQGVLTKDKNPAGEGATANQPNLYLYESDAKALSFLATLAPDDQGKLWGLARSFGNGAYAVPLLGGSEGGDGHVLLITSKAPLSEADEDGGFADIFGFDTEAETLQCLSCTPAAGAFDAAAGANEGLPTLPSSNFATLGRWASEDGQSVAFVTAEPLLEGDADEALNAYLWREGQLARLPGLLKTIFQRPVVSADGEQVGFTSAEPLLPQDGDTARDAYALKANGGFPNPTPPAICDPLSEGSCQGPPSNPGQAPGIATSTFTGPGNQKGTSRPRCRKGKVRRRGRCVKPKPRKGKRAANRKRAAR